MSSAVLTTLVLAQLLTPARRAELRAVAASSPRPVVCVTGASSPGARQTVWDRARTPGLHEYCTALARGYGRLHSKPAVALTAAKAAQEAAGPPAAAAALAGRALLRLGQHDEAWQQLRRARRLDSRSLDAPAALHDYAVAAALAGRASDALAAYRKLVPQAALLADAYERQRVYVEAATLTIAVGNDGLDEAIGYLTEARRQGVAPGYRPFVLGALALAFELSGQSDQARGSAAEADGSAGLQRFVPVRTGAGVAPSSVPLIPLPVLHAMLAVLAERDDRALAREQWQICLRKLGETKSPLRDHAQARIEKLGSGGRRGRTR